MKPGTNAKTPQNSKKDRFVGCGGRGSEGVNRRQFIKVAGTGALAMLASRWRASGVFTNAAPLTSLCTRYARVRIDANGFITSIISLNSKKEYCPVGHPSPLMSLHEYKQPYDRLVFPTSAAFDAQKQEIMLNYPNGAAAVVKATAAEKLFRFQLVSLATRGNVDNIVWGPIHTTISKIIKHYGL